MTLAVMSQLARTTMQNKYAWIKPSGHKESWEEIAERQVTNVVEPYLPGLRDRIYNLIASRKFIPGGRYLYATGRKFPQVNNCMLFKAEDSKEGWGQLMNKITVSLMSGGGVGVVYSTIRPEASHIEGMGGKSTGPCALMRMVNESGRYIMQGGSRRSAVWAGLIWWHPDAMKFVCIKDWSKEVRSLKQQDFNFPASMDGTNISVILDNDFFDAYNDPTWIRTYKLGGQAVTISHSSAREIYWNCIRHMLKTGEPGFSVDIGENEGENCRNACCEVTSRDDSDMCNLGSINLSAISSPEDFAEAVDLGIAFLLCGTIYSKLPTENMYRVREKNRRLGLGLMGVHDWLLKRGKKYGKDSELAEWMRYFTMSGSFANRYADKLGISRPIATRSIAPTGTISIIADTTSGIEPIFASAYKRRYLDGKDWKWQYRVDNIAKKLIDSGTDPDLIEDSLTLAEDVERRLEFQAWLQAHVDHGISSTINLPPWGSSLNNESRVTSFGNLLLKYLPQLRGITTYPDGSRDGQPLVRCSYTEAIKNLGVEFVDSGTTEAAVCKNGVCGE